MLSSVFSMFLKEYKTDLVESEPNDCIKKPGGSFQHFRLPCVTIWISTEPLAEDLACCCLGNVLILLTFSIHL